MKKNKIFSYVPNLKNEQNNKENYPVRVKSQKFKTIQQKSVKFTNPHYIYTNTKPLKSSKQDNQKLNSCKIKQKQIIKFPQICTQMRHHNIFKSPTSKPTTFSSLSHKQAHSMKRIVTQNTYFNQSIKKQQNMKDTLIKIMQNKSCRQQLSIQQQINKLDILTKRYSHLRKDLISIQQDLMTISFKRIMRKDSPQNFITSHASNPKSNNLSLVKGNFQL